MLGTSKLRSKAYLAEVQAKREKLFLKTKMEETPQDLTKEELRKLNGYGIVPPKFTYQNGVIKEEAESCVSSRFAKNSQRTKNSVRKRLS